MTDEAKQRNIRLFYWHQACFHFSHIMIAFVAPVFLYQLFNSISIVFVWALVWAVTFLLTFLPGFNLAMRCKHPKYIMALGVLLNCGGLLLFGQADKEHLWYLVPALFLSCFHMSTYWMVRHWIFSVSSDYKRIGEQVSILGVIQVFIACVAPLAGGYLSYYHSFNAAFLLGTAAVFLSVIPILMFDDTFGRVVCPVRELPQILAQPQLKAIRLSYLSEGFIEAFFRTGWILVFAIFLGDIKSFGTMVGGTTLISAGLIYLTGRWFDLRGRAAILKVSTWIRAGIGVGYLLILFIPGAALIWIIDTLNRFAGQVHGTVCQAYIYGYSNRMHPVHFHINRQVYVTTGRIISNTIMIVTFLFAPPEYLWIFVGLGGAAFLGWLTLQRSDYLLHETLPDEVKERCSLVLVEDKGTGEIEDEEEDEDERRAA